MCSSCVTRMSFRAERGISTVAASPSARPRRHGRDSSSLVLLGMTGRWAPLGLTSRRSPVARRAARLALDVVLLDELPADLGLVGRRLPGHVEDLVARPDVARGVHVAVDAPAHLERLGLGREL